MTKNNKFTDLYVCAPDTIRGQEPRIRDYMPAIRMNNGKEVAILTVNGEPKEKVIELAHKMAAAPDLFEALVELSDAFNDLDPFNLRGGVEFEGSYIGSDEKGNIILCRALENAKNLIEKNKEKVNE